jgi:phosphonate transport system permease protein
VITAKTPGQEMNSFEVYEKERLRKGKQQLPWKAAAFAAFLAAIFVASRAGEVSLQVLARGIPELGDYFSRIAPQLRIESLPQDFGAWFWGWKKWLKLLADTVLIGFVSTVLGVLAALPLSVLGAANLSGRPRTSFLVRRIVDAIRAIPAIVLAIIFVFSFGIGPLAGVLALAIHSSCVLAKLFAEANENISDRSLEGVWAAGANRIQVIGFGAIPQVLPQYMSYSLYRFESNVRSASVLGLVGAGGIGQELMFVVRQFIYADISAIVLMILMTVVIIDLSCERIRGMLIFGEKA